MRFFQSKGFLILGFSNFSFFFLFKGFLIAPLNFKILIRNTVLELHGNGIHKIDGNLRSSQLPLVHLRLHNNNFTEFPESLPDSIQALVLMNNNIHSISKRALISGSKIFHGICKCKIVIFNRWSASPALTTKIANDKTGPIIMKRFDRREFRHL